MRLAFIGAGRGALYSAILLKLADPAHEGVVWERNAIDDTFGFGVVFSPETLDNLRTPTRCPSSGSSSSGASGRRSTRLQRFTERSDGHAFAALSRKQLLVTLAERAAELGVELHHLQMAPPLEQLRAEFDLVVGADGVNSLTRDAIADTIGSHVVTRPFNYVWYGTDRPVDCFTFLFVDTPYGMFWAHIYPYDDKHSTFLMETDPETWRKAEPEFARPRVPRQSDGPRWPSASGSSPTTSASTA